MNLRDFRLQARELAIDNGCVCQDCVHLRENIVMCNFREFVCSISNKQIINPYDIESACFDFEPIEEKKQEFKIKVQDEMIEILFYKINEIAGD